MKKMLTMAALVLISLFASMPHAKASGGYWDYTLEKRGMTFAPAQAQEQAECDPQAKEACAEQDDEEIATDVLITTGK